MTEKKVTLVDQKTAIKNAIKAEKHFSLFRKIYSKNDKDYSVYSVFIILDGYKKSFVEIQLLPDIGFVGGATAEEKKNLTTTRNAAGYSLLNWLYESGTAINLYKLSSELALPYGQVIYAAHCRTQHLWAKWVCAAGTQKQPRSTHSVGCVGPDDGVIGTNLYGNHWNQSGVEKCVHAFIGKDKNGVLRCYQTLPWEHRPWGCASGRKGSYNDSHIQFEICDSRS